MAIDSIARALSGQANKVATDAIAAAEEAIHTATEQIPSIVTDWLDDNVTPVGSAVVVDSSLSISGAAADAKATGDGLTDIKNAFAPYNAVDALSFSSPVSRTNLGVTFDFNADKSCYVHGTSTSVASGQYFIDQSSIPSWITLGKEYNIKYSSTNVWFQIWDYSGGTLTKLLETKTDSTFTFPSNITGLLIRLAVSSGVTANETVHPRIISAASNQELDVISKKVMYPKFVNPTNGSYVLSNISDPGMYIPDVSYPTSDAPTNFSQRTYFLEVESFNYQGVANRFTKQTVYGVGSGITGKIYYRMSNYSGTYGDWNELGSGGGNVTNNYTFNEYSQTLTVNATPSITTDTNSYLAPSGNTTDRTADILAMLNSTGVCRLGKGNYYIKNLIMPEGTSIIGCGQGTSVRLSTDSGAEYAIKLNSMCSVENFSLYGMASSFTANSSVRNRTGILWQGTYTADQSAPYRSFVKNLWIYNFEGSGIKCYDTGYGGDCSIIVDNVFIWNCDAGINIAYWSEFNKLTNVRASACYYGCINNGGNNMFTNCDFSSNKLCFLMDNSSSQSPNNSHGSCVGCVFNHADSNTGFGIKILNCDNGFVFDACQSFYAQIDIEDSDGVTISNSNFGSSNGTITIKNGGAVLFANNLYGAAPTISITNNNKVHFSNCYVRSTGATVSA